jgi:thiol-disulfide isomerase/thioredoxin
VWTTGAAPSNPVPTPGLSAAATPIGGAATPIGGAATPIGGAGAMTPPPAEFVGPEPEPPASDPVAAHLYVVAVNGGGRREINYRSHLQHVRALAALLTAAGVPASHVAIFSADGEDTAADVATKDSLIERGAWLLPANVAGSIGPQIEYVSSTVEGYALRPARLEELRTWFGGAGRRLVAGDTLLFYVTDHGDKNDADPRNNTITLWGEKLSVSELREMLTGLDPGVRVVLLMSQCFSGAFARLMYAHDDDAAPSGNVCGFFSVPADRPAYGCYPENRGKERVGHSHRFLEALAEMGQFSAAEQRVLVDDDTPDMPHATSDVLFERRLRAAAEAADQAPRDYVDALLADAWRDRAAYEPEIRVLDRIGHAYGTFSPRSVAELDEQTRALPELSSRLSTYAERWQDTLDALLAENFSRFVDAYPHWKIRLAPDKVRDLDDVGRRILLRAVLAQLVPFTGHDPVRHERLVTLKRKATAAAAARYRAEVRVAVVRRLRSVLLRVAARAQLAREAREGRDAEAWRRETDALARCEDFTLRAAPPPAGAVALGAAPPFPPLADEQQTLADLSPAFMGIEFHPLEEAKRVRRGMRKGAVTVMRVYPDSAAERAGLDVGDVILGPPGAPFEEPNQVREWTMRRQVDVPAPLTVWRDGELRTVTIRPGPFPLELPKLPGPPKVGSVAPPLEVEMFRGELHASRPRLLFFWATWCTICKQAVPEVLAYEQTHDVEVVAITDEDAETLRPFFRDMHDEFPSLVAMDQRRHVLQAYGVSGTPTFVLLDGAGIIRQYQTGYPKEGLRIEGWHWREDTKALGSR